VPSVFPALAALLAFLAHLASAAAPAPQPPLSHLIGQKLVVRVDARRPTGDAAAAWLAARVASDR